jgi:hypothetical protein
MAHAAKSASEEPSLQALEDTLLATIQTLDRLDEFTLPSEQPDNKGLAVNLCATSTPVATNAPHYDLPSHPADGAHRRRTLVDDLNHTNAAAASVTATIPTEVVHAFVDQGRPPDEFVAAQHKKAQFMSDDVRAKQHAIKCLADSIRVQGAALLSDASHR